MQKRHYEIIARVIRDMQDRGAAAVAAQAFGRDLCATNAKFDRARFLTACGV